MPSVRLSIVAVVALAAAGCLTATPDADQDEPALGATPFAFSFQPPVKVGAGGDAETSIRLSADGQTILACSHGGFTRPSPMWASTDAGASFRRVVPGPNPVVSGDCDVAITDNGDWFIVFDTIASASVAVSDDNGESWNIFPIAGQPFGGVDRPWLEAVGNTVYLTYADVMAVEPFVGMFTKSTDGGRTWAPPTMMGRFQSQTETNCFTGHPIVHDQGKTVRVPISCSGESVNNQVNTVYFLVSRDAGASWTREKVHGPDTTDIRVPTAAYAGDGTLWLAYTQGTPDNRTTVAQISTDDGKTWSEPATVFANMTDEFGWPWIDGRTDGSATIVTMHNTRPANTTGEKTWWQVTGARLVADPVPRVVATKDIGEPYEGSQLLEYINVRHGPDDRAYVLYPMAGPGCAAPPPGTEAQGRNVQCVWFAAESI
jgi:hypothetical protein